MDTINYGRADNAVGDQVNRFGVLYGQGLSNGWDFGGTFELGLAPKPSNQVSQLDQSNSAWSFDQTSLRKFEVSFSDERLGTVFFGQGDMSARGGGPDFSGSSAVMSSNPADVAGGNFWRVQGSGAMSGRQLNDSFDDFDTGRRFRLRYDTPQFGNFGFSASVGREVLISGDDSTNYDVLGRSTKNWARYGLEVELSYNGLGNDDYATRGGIAFIHRPSGINIAAAVAYTS